MVLKYTEFKNGLDGNKPSPAYLFEGEDSFFRERGLNMLRVKFVTEPEINAVTLSADCSYGELSASLEGYPFMSEYRLPYLENFIQNKNFSKVG